jgi:hypothetical protein
MLINHMNLDSQMTIFSNLDQYQKQGSGECVILAGIHKSIQVVPPIFSPFSIL